MVKRFAEHNENVVFGDIALSEGGPRLGQPGAGGWPTVRIFTPETGVEGETYQKKTSKAMCDELKEEFYLQSLIEEVRILVCCTTDGLQSARSWKQTLKRPQKVCTHESAREGECAVRCLLLPNITRACHRDDVIYRVSTCTNLLVFE